VRLSSPAAAPFSSYVLHVDILQKRPTTPTLKHRALSYLKNTTKSFEYTLEVLRNLEKQTRDEIQRLGGNPGLEDIMDTLHVHEDALP
jgi:geranylgeranyl diphosphate synthase type 3